MALSAKVVSFLLSDDVVGTTQAITGVGFQPKAIIFWWGGNTSAVDSVVNDNSHFGAGFAESATERGCIGAWVNNNEATMETAVCIREDQIAATVDGTDLTVGRWDLVSMDADGFTVIVDQDASVANGPRVHALCLGGTDITNVDFGAFTKAGATGNQAVAGVGFQPDVVFFLTTGEGGPSPDSDSTARYSLGVARSAAEQMVLHGFSEDGLGESNTERYHNHSECVMGRINSSFAQQRGSLVSLDADGFTINWLAGTATLPVLYLALKGGGWKIGNTFTSTLLTTISVSGFGFAPKGVMVLSHCAVSASTPGTMQANMMLSVGAGDSPTSRRCQSDQEDDALATSSVWKGISFDEVYQNLTGGGGMVGEMDIQSFDADGITFVMDDADPSARTFGYVACGDTPAAGGPPGPNALMLLGVGQ